MSKHTPGPWFIWQERAGATEDELLEDTEHSIMAGEPTECTPSCISGASTVVCVSDMEECNSHDDIRLANARLIAAAPELLEACKAALARMMQQNGSVAPQVWADNYDSMVTLQAAIAKAEGK